MIRTPARFTIRPRLAALIFTAAIAAIAAIGAVGVVVPAGAGAYASIEGPPVFSSAPGLPDGRVYEQVSPEVKNGNQAGATTSPFLTGAKDHYGFVSPDGDAVLFEGTGPMGASPWADSDWFVATKNVGVAGWSTRALLPRASSEVFFLHGGKAAAYLDPSSDLSHALVSDYEDLGPVGPNPCMSPEYLAGPNPFVPAVWIGQPSAELMSPVENCLPDSWVPVGGSPDFSRVYFAYAGTLLPEDASRTSHSGTGALVESWGFYEYSGGALKDAGILPDGSVDPFGAVPAASGHGRNRVGNEVSEDGARAFFVSPDPQSCEPTGANDCATDPPELYVRENGEHTVLVSRDLLLPESGGLPVGAPGGVLAMANPSSQLHLGGDENKDGSEVFASADGSHAFFQSDDALTKQAQKDSPGPAPKTYEFDVTTGVLTYLPAVEGEIIAVARDGSAMAFVRPEGGGELPQLEFWAAHAEEGGTVTPVAALPDPDQNVVGGSVPEARISNEGQVLVFQTAQRLSAAFNSGGYEEIYRYDAPANTLGCLSCPPAGITPRENAMMSTLRWDEEQLTGRQHIENGVEATLGPFVDQRAISADGNRVFFESADPLTEEVQNTNSPERPVIETTLESQGRNVFEWENGTVYLISTGASSRNTWLLGSSESGDDVFIATTQGLVPGDTDGGYDVYDARVPRAGDSAPVAAVPCEGAVCQGPPNVPSPLTPPASATFSGLGNPTPEVAPSTPTKTTTKTLKCAKGKKLSYGKCVKRSKSKIIKRASHDGRAK